MAMPELQTIVEALRRNAAAISALASGVSDEQARWKPEPAKWSILEVVTHLADEEVEDFRARLDATLRRPDEPWSPIDPEKWAVERSYNEGVLAEQTERFLTRRSESIAWLAALDAPDWTRAHAHPRFGPISAGELVTGWVAHDHIHIRQLNRLHREFLVARVSPHSPRYAGAW